MTQDFSSLLARDEIFRHAKMSPVRGTLPDADIVYEDTNPLCGDTITVFATIDRTGPSPVISAFRYTGSGCIISQAAASLLAEEIVGMPLDAVQHLERPDMERLFGGEVSVSRVKCLLLALVALKRGMAALPSSHP